MSLIIEPKSISTSALRAKEIRQERYSRDRNHSDCANSVVFDRGRSENANPVLRFGLAGSNFGNGDFIFGHFRNRPNTPPARETVTAKLLGDPAPDRVVPEIEPERNWERPASPIHLTFRAYRAANGES